MKFRRRARLPNSNLVRCKTSVRISLSKSLPWDTILAALILVQSIAVAQNISNPIASANFQISVTDRLTIFDKAWETIDKNFFDPKFNGVNWAQMKDKYRPLAEAATDKVQLLDVFQKMLGELHTSHTAASADFQFGTGLGYSQIEDRWLVNRIAPGSPAQLAGIERGWILTGSGGDCIGSNRNVSVHFLDLREQARSATLTCATYASAPEPAATVRALDGTAVYLPFTSFTTGPGTWFADQVVRNKSAQTLVLDLRGNWGGSLEIAQKIFALFFTEKTDVGAFRDRKGKTLSLKMGGNKSAYRGRILVLTDRNTGSAAEVFASAVQESGRGIVVGQRSKGGVLGATHYKLPNGFDLHVALMDYHTVKGVRLEGRGVIPDVAVDLTIKDFREDRDAVLDRVRQLLQSP
jgi:carboxyl-terminal processing protease